MSEPHCCETRRSSTLAQNLDSMEFERGIWSAASEGELLKVFNFLKQGKNADIRDSAGYTALHYAALKGHIEICEMLLTYGADIDAVTRAGMASALHRATTSGKVKLVEFLINNRANVALKDVDGRTALHRAAINGRKEIFDLLSHRYPELLSMVDNKNKLPADYNQN